MNYFTFQGRSEQPTLAEEWASNQSKSTVLTLFRSPKL